MSKIHDFTSPQTSKIISDLGIRWKGSSYWQLVGKNIYELKNKLEPFRQGFAAYNLTDLGHLIPFGLFNEMKINKFLNNFFKVEINGEWQTYASETEARAHYLIHMIRSGKATVKEITEKPVQMDAKLPVPKIK